MKSNRSIPAAAVIPVLRYPDPREAAAWLERAFGFTERLRIANHRVQMTWAGGALVAAEGEAAPGVSVMIRVEDAAAHWARAMAAGAVVVHPLEAYPYGERQFTVSDPAGYRWTFSETFADVDPADWGGEVPA